MGKTHWPSHKSELASQQERKIQALMECAVTDTLLPGHIGRGQETANQSNKRFQTNQPMNGNISLSIRSGNWIEMYQRQVSKSWNSWG